MAAFPQEIKESKKENGTWLVGFFLCPLSFYSDEDRNIEMGTSISKGLCLMTSILLKTFISQWMR